MKTILVPTDFSKSADNALKFAIELAKKQKAKIMLLHAFQLTYVAPDTPMQLISEEITIMEKKALKRLSSLAAKVEKLSKLTCEFINKEGSAVDVILDTIKRKKIKLVVMGTKGASGIKQILMGSNTAKVISKALCPVIAVPEKASFDGIKKITYATDYHVSDISSLKQLVDLAKIYKAKINILHIADQEYTHETEKEFMNEFVKKINRKISYKNISYELIYDKNIEKSIEKYMKNNPVNLLVMSARYRKLFDRIFGKSITRQLAYHTKVPLMVFHYKQESTVLI